LLINITVSQMPYIAALLCVWTVPLEHPRVHCFPQGHSIYNSQIIPYMIQTYQLWCLTTLSHHPIMFWYRNSGSVE